jgi:hypothetical protein
MAKITSKRRNDLSNKEFALPKERKYPLDTKGRQINAKARATQMEEEGKLNKSTAAKIKAKANKKLGKGKKEK